MHEFVHRNGDWKFGNSHISSVNQLVAIVKKCKYMYGYLKTPGWMQTQNVSNKATMCKNEVCCHGKTMRKI